MYVVWNKELTRIVTTKLTDIDYEKGERIGIRCFFCDRYAGKKDICEECDRLLQQGYPSQKATPLTSHTPTEIGRSVVMGVHPGNLPFYITCDQVVWDKAKKIVITRNLNRIDKSKGEVKGYECRICGEYSGGNTICQTCIECAFSNPRYVHKEKK